MAPRAGPEDKLPWQRVPREVREATAAALGLPVARATRAWGGYAPSATYRLFLADGRRAFFKGVHAGSNAHMREALAVEERVYRELGAVVGPWAPAFLGAIRLGEWHALLLEDLGPPSVPPWTAASLRAAARGLAELHRHCRGRDLPAWIPQGRHSEFATRWAGFLADDGIERMLEVAGDLADDARAWLRSALPSFTASGGRLADAPPPHTLLHFDARSDNLRIVDGRLRLFDWNWASTGPPEFDLAAFAQSIPVEGGGDAEHVVALYAEVLPVRDDVLTSSLAAIAPHFLRGVWQPDVPGLPRLRPFQRAQAVTTVAWAARRLCLPEPAWLERLVERMDGAGGQAAGSRVGQT